MDDEEKYRLEEVDEEEEKTGFAKPLPESPKRDGKPIVNFLGFSITEDRRDLIVFIITPIIAGLADAAIYANITTNFLPESQIYRFAMPMLAAIPIGILLHRPGRALIGGFLSVIYFAAIYILFLVSPAFYDPNTPIGDFFISAITITVGYFYFVSMASLLGAFIGLLMREFL